MDKIRIPAFAEECARKAQETLDHCAKLPGSLGRLEDLAVRLAGITACAAPVFARKSLVLFAADHNIVRRGASASDQSVTELQMRNFARGGGVINAFCRTASAGMTLVDVGMLRDVDIPNVLCRKVVHAARDFSEGPAMTRSEAVACLQVGIDMARREAAAGVQLLAAGEMGIGNTSPAAAMAAVLTGLPMEDVTAMGLTMTPESLQHKIALLRRAVALNAPDPADPLDVLAKVGGPEIGAMAGLMLGAASLRIPVVIDGHIATVAALLAERLFPGACTMLVGSHVSAAPGHAQIMAMLGIPTCLDLGMRLGEGTGAVLLFPVIDSAVRILHEVPPLDSLSLA